MVIGVRGSKNIEAWKTALPEKKKRKTFLTVTETIYCGNILVFKRIIYLVVCKQILVSFNGYDSSKDAA